MAKRKVYLYVIAQDMRPYSDTYDAAVVAAHSEEEARQIHPDGRLAIDGPDAWPGYSCTWYKRPENVRVTRIGTAAADIEPGVIVASFNAG